jgi:hypothetical protein
MKNVSTFILAVFATALLSIGLGKVAASLDPMARSHQVTHNAPADQIAEHGTLPCVFS